MRFLGSSFVFGLSCVVLALLFICSCCVPARCLLCSCFVLALFLLLACHAFALCLPRARSARARARNVSPRARGGCERGATMLLQCSPSESRAPCVDTKKTQRAPELLLMLASALLIRLRSARPSKCGRSEISLALIPAVAKKGRAIAMGAQTKQAGRQPNQRIVHTSRSARCRRAREKLISRADCPPNLHRSHFGSRYKLG